MNAAGSLTAFLVLLTFQNSAEALSCSECIHPKFQGRALYLPFCLEGNTYNNLCDAICSRTEDELKIDYGKPTKGSCGKCEMKCNNVFVPTCTSASTSETSMVFPNKCHAKCSGIEYEDCNGFPFPPVIPGKTKLPNLPISNESPDGLQNLSKND